MNTILRTLLVFAVLAVAGLIIPAALAEDSYDATIQSPVPFMGNNGEIFKLSDGSVWEVKYEYEYMYEYYPAVVMFPVKGKMLIEGKMLNVMQHSGQPTQKIEHPLAVNKLPSTESVIETCIEDDFEGWDGDTIFKLGNGQIWQQTSYEYTYHYAYRPGVIIYSTSGGYKMKVDGVDGTIYVKRIR